MAISFVILVESPVLVSVVLVVECTLAGKQSKLLALSGRPLEDCLLAFLIGDQFPERGGLRYPGRDSHQWVRRLRCCPQGHREHRLLPTKEYQHRPGKDYWPFITSF